jgi:predicted  nucleic acid-binding Zn-ribbon protein
VRRVTTLEPLLALQERDLALDRLRHQRATLPERARLAGLTHRLDTLAAAREARQAQRDEVARQEQRYADEAAQLGEQAGAAERRLYSGEVASPRELQALQADVEQLRRRQRTIEDRELGAMEQREPLEGELATVDAEWQAAETEAARTREELGQRQRELDSSLAAEQAARDQLAAGIEPGLIADYERRRARANGVGAARLVGSTCQGCHLSIPATEVDRIRRRVDGAVAYCDNCGCILVP